MRKLSHRAKNYSFSPQSTHAEIFLLLSPISPPKIFHALVSLSSRDAILLREFQDENRISTAKLTNHFSMRLPIELNFGALVILGYFGDM